MSMAVVTVLGNVGGRVRALSWGLSDAPVIVRDLWKSGKQVVLYEAGFIEYLPHIT
jgi:hypothetical protein